MTDDEPLLTLEQALALMVQAWEAFERSIFEHVEAEAIAQGFSPPAVRFFVEEYARMLAARRPRQLETARAMLEAHALNLH
jgi:hypothetical protein